MMIVGLLIKGLLDLMQAKLNIFLKMPVEVTDGCLIMGNGDIGKNDINTNALNFNYQKSKILNRDNRIFNDIIEILNGIENYEEELILTGTSAGSSVDPFNIIPYGLPSNCHSKLVVIIDGNKDIGFIINKALLQVGIACKGVTSYVLFYITIDKTKWVDIWSLYQPAFHKLERENQIECFEYHKP